MNATAIPIRPIRTRRKSEHFSLFCKIYTEIRVRAEHSNCGQTGNVRAGKSKDILRASKRNDNDANQKQCRHTGSKMPGMVADPSVNVVRAAVIMEGPALKAFTA